MKASCSPCATGLDAGGDLILVDTVDAQGAGFNRAFTAGCTQGLVSDAFVNKRTCLVRAGHHAITAADTDVFVDQCDAVFTLERRTCGANVDTGCGLAMLAHQRQGQFMSGLFVTQRYLAYILCVCFRAVVAHQAVLSVTGIDAVCTALFALVGVDQHTPAHRVSDRLIIGLGAGYLVQENTRCYRDRAYSNGLFQGSCVWSG